MLILGAIILEFTANPAIALATLCIKFGWEDWGTAMWLRKADPDRSRGRACSWMYLAAGVWKASLTAVFTVIATLPVMAALGPILMNAIVNQFVSAILFAVAGFGLVIPLSGVAIAAALRRGVKVWVGPESHRARRDGSWPPRSVPFGRASNQAPGMLTASLAFTLIGLVLVTVTIVVVLGPRLIAQPRSIANALLILIGIVLPIIGCVLVLVLRDLVDRRVIAVAPEECWSDDPLSR